MKERKREGERERDKWGGRGGERRENDIINSFSLSFRNHTASLLLHLSKASY